MTSSEKMTTKVGSLTLQYPTLSRDNYASWAIKMKVYMKAQDVWDAIEPAAGASVEHRKDQMALAAIYQGIPEETLMVIAEKQTAKEAWETLKTMHLGADRVRNAKVQTLKSEFELLRMKENDNVDDFSTKLTGVVNKIRALGGEMEENYVVRKLLRAVPERFLTIVSTIEQFGDIDDMTLEEAIGRLKAHEERARVFRNNVDDHLLLTHAEWQARSKKNGGGFLSTPTTNDGSGRGRGRGAGRGRGRGQRGRGGQQYHGSGQQYHGSGQQYHGSGQQYHGGRGGEHGGQAGRGGFGGRGGRPGGGFGHGGAARQEGESSTSGGRDKSNIKCFNCGVYGHFQSECHKQRRNNEQEAHLTRAYDEEPTLMMAMLEESSSVILLNEEKVMPDLLTAGEAHVDNNTWYLDNGASNHMTGHRDKFKELDENIKGTVKFGDGSAVEIKGKGSILFQCNNGDQRLLPEVYYIPSLKSNIISLGQMTEDGSKVVIADEYLRVFDRNGALLMRVTRSTNRLYRIELKTCKPACLMANINDPAWLWHARLGHVNFFTLKMMTEKQFLRPQDDD
ncbi:uncharacterized protein LOC109836694 [Asparagus officinalis]|uniref:uncharacterized protein LOC109836694 n=1 Tax=Asparagus officinalis TaxID=4686 RepID=UPI00098DFC37|nr:uncharacterized protein LOC109836694 [Asparagus officinalis]